MAATTYPATPPRAAARGPLATLLALLGEELAPRPHRVRSTVRAATIGALGAGIMAAAHVDSPLGPYLVWLLAGTPTAMMTWRTAVYGTAFEGFALAVAVVLARVLAQSPVLTLATLALFVALATDLIGRYQLGAFGLITEVLVLDIFYGVMFAPSQLGWSATYTFAGVAIAMGVIALADQWLWPDPAAAILDETLADWLRRLRVSLRAAMDAYMAPTPGPAAALKLRADDLGPYLELLARAQAEGLSHHRRGVLGAAVTRAARLQTRLDQLVSAAQAPVPRDLRQLAAAPFAASTTGLADALEELADHPDLMLRAGSDEPPSPAAARLRTLLATLDTAADALPADRLDRASAVERANLSDCYSALHGLGRLLERPLDESVVAPHAVTPAAAPRANPDPAHSRYCLKVAIAIVAGYVIGLTSQRADLSVILTTIIITALPTYGAAARKILLRLVGGILGGLFTVLLIIIVTPNFETLPVYMMAIFIVLLISDYTGQGSQRIAYAGKQVGTTFMLAYAGLGPSAAVEAPLWRIWGVLLGTVVVLLVTLTIWPSYAGDALPLRLRRLLGLTIALAPQAHGDRATLERLDAELNGLLEETLAVADDARFEGRASRLNPGAVVQTASTLRRLAHRFEALHQFGARRPALDPPTEEAARAVLDGVLARLQAWLTWLELPAGGLAIPTARPALPLADPVASLTAMTTRIEAHNFAQLTGWSLMERRNLFADLEGLRRLVFLSGELEEFMVRVRR